MPRETKLKVQVIDYNEVYPFRLIIAYKKDGNFIQMLNELIPDYPELKEGLGEMEDTILAFTYCIGNTGNIFLFVTEDVAIDILVHECVHIASRVFEATGSYINEETEELYAYLLEYIFREVYRTLTNTFKVKMKIIRG